MFISPLPLFKRTGRNTFQCLRQDWGKVLYKCNLDNFGKNRKVWDWDRRVQFKVVSCREEEGSARISSEKGNEAVALAKKQNRLFPRQKWVRRWECSLVTHNEISNYIWNLLSGAWNVMDAVLRLKTDPVPCNSKWCFLHCLEKNNMTVCMRCLFLISELPAVDDHQLAPGGQVVHSTTREEAYCSAVDRQKSLPK